MALRYHAHFLEEEGQDLPYRLEKDLRCIDARTSQYCSSSLGISDENCILHYGWKWWNNEKIVHDRMDSIWNHNNNNAFNSWQNDQTTKRPKWKSTLTCKTIFVWCIPRIGWLHFVEWSKSPVHHSQSTYHQLSPRLQPYLNTNAIRMPTCVD